MPHCLQNTDDKVQMIGCGFIGNGTQQQEDEASEANHSPKTSNHRRQIRVDHVTPAADEVSIGSTVQWPWRYIQRIPAGTINIAIIKNKF